MQWHCAIIELPLVAPINGFYKIIRKDRIAVILNTAYLANQPFSFTNRYSENETMTFQVLNSDGEVITDVDGNDCFRVKIVPYKDFNSP